MERSRQPAERALDAVTGEHALLIDPNHATTALKPGTHRTDVIPVSTGPEAVVRESLVLIDLDRPGRHTQVHSKGAFAQKGASGTALARRWHSHAGSVPDAVPPISNRKWTSG